MQKKIGTMDDRIREEAVKRVQSQGELPKGFPVFVGWSIEKGGMGGPMYFMDTVYTEKATANAARADMREEHMDFKVKEIAFIRLPDGHALALGDSFGKVSGQRVLDYLRERGLAKLDAEEREALGL